MVPDARESWGWASSSSHCTQGPAALLGGKARSVRTQCFDFAIYISWHGIQQTAWLCRGMGKGKMNVS